jgi:hypothetical protein
MHPPGLHFEPPGFKEKMISASTNCIFLSNFFVEKQSYLSGSGYSTVLSKKAGIRIEIP